MSALASQIRRRRTELGWTLQQLATAARCTKSYLSLIENDRLDNPPSRRLLERLECALTVVPGQLVGLADWLKTPASVRDQVAKLAAAAEQSRTVRIELRQALNERDNGTADLDALYRSGVLQRWVKQEQGNLEPIGSMCVQVPLINRVAAGYPTDFTDLGYPARVADEQVDVPQMDDVDAFAARVVGDSMLPSYQAGDVIVFSPSREPTDGSDCFVRLLPDHQTTFKRVYFEDEDRVRLQPLNAAFKPQVVARDQIAGLYPAVYRMQALR